MINGKVAVLIPCLNEEYTIASVVRAFRASLQDADIYVYDNNSTDNTVEIAKREGAIVRSEKRQGKGFVVVSMFRDIEADYYVLADGDGTYPADKVGDLLGPLVKREADMVVGTRLENFEDKSFRPLHTWGNRFITGTVNLIFGVSLKDVLSGYRAFTRDFVKNIPIRSRGFEVEVEMTMKALDYNFAIVEVPIKYKSRPEKSHSKLNTFEDGVLIMTKIISIFKDYKPFLFFSVIAFLTFLLGLIPGLLATIEFIQTQQVTRVTAATFAVGCTLLSFLLFMTGIIIDTVNTRVKDILAIQRKHELEKRSDDRHSPSQHEK